MTGWAVALTCYKSHSANYNKRWILTPHGVKTTKLISMKLCTATHNT